MPEETTFDKTAYHEHHLRCLERELAAVWRQYRRAGDATDQAAEEVEREAICDPVRRLLYEHLDLRVGMSSDDWVWLNGQEGECRIEEASDLQLRASGRFYCSLPDGHRQWTEPFEANIRHCQSTNTLSDYTIWFGNRATLLNIPKVRQMIAAGEVLTPPAPKGESEWAFVFRMGDRA